MVPARPPLAASNPQIKNLRRLLGRRRARRDTGQFVLEGPTLVAEARSAGVPLHQVFVDADVGFPGERWPTLADLDPDLIRPVAPGVLARVLDTVTPQPIAAVATQPLASLGTVVVPGAGPASPVVVLAGVADPGNVGTIVRGAGAVGATVVALPGTADPFGPKAVRASAGAVLRVPVAEATVDDLLPALTTAGFAVWVADAAEGVAPEDAPLTGPVAVVVGNEAHGVPGDLVAAATGRLRIPMAAGTESLNAAMAATILLYEAARQGRRIDGRSGERGA